MCSIYKFVISKGLLFYSILLMSRTVLCQSHSYTLTQMLEMYEQTDMFQMAQADSAMYSNNRKLFKIKVLPVMSLSVTAPNVTNSINAVTQPDGSELFVNRFYSSSSFSVNVTQFVPFTGGTITMSSSLVRLDNYNPSRNKSFNLNLFNLSYSQNLLGLNPYKWEKKENTVKDEIQQIVFLQDRERAMERMVDAFFELFYAQEEYRILSEGFTLSERLSSIAKELYPAGRISYIDYIYSQIELSHTQVNKNTLNISKAQKELSSILNIEEMDLTAVYNVSEILNTPLSYDKDVVMGRLEAVSISPQQRLISIQNKYKLKQAQSGRTPTISLNMGGGMNSQTKQLRNILGPFNSKMSIVAGISLPICEWGKNRLLMRVAKTNIEKSSLAQRGQIKDLRREFEYDLGQIEVLRESIENKFRLADLYRTSIKLLMEKYTYGMIDITDIIKAEQELIKVQLEQIREAKSFYSIVYKYRRLALVDIRTGEIIS